MPFGSIGPNVTRREPTITIATDDARRQTEGPAKSVPPAQLPPATERLLPDSRRGRWFVVAALALALVLRLGVIAADRNYQPLNDSQHYDLIASSLAGGHGFGNAVLLGASGPTAYRAPLYPAALAAVYVVFGEHSWTAGRVENAFIGVALVALLALVATQLWGRRVGAVALAIAAVHPTLMLFGSGLQLEPLLACLVVASIAAALQHRRTRQLQWLIASGVLIGLTALTRETGLLLIPVVALLVWDRSRRPSLAALRAPLLVALLALLTIAPWTIRNAVRLHTFVPVSTSGGYTLAGTYNDTSLHDPQNPGIWIPDERDPTLRQLILDRLPYDEATLDKTLRSAALDFIRAHPAAVPKTMFWNALRLFDLAGPGHAEFYAQYVPYPRRLTTVSVYASWIVGLVAIAGIAMGAARKTPFAVWLFPLLAIVFLSFVSGEIRYRASIEPFTVLLAAASAVALYDAWRRRSTDQAHAVATSTPAPS